MTHGEGVEVFVWGYQNVIEPRRFIYYILIIGIVAKVVAIKSYSSDLYKSCLCLPGCG